MKCMHSSKPPEGPTRNMAITNEPRGIGQHSCSNRLYSAYGVLPQHPFQDYALFWGNVTFGDRTIYKVPELKIFCVLEEVFAMLLLFSRYLLMMTLSLDRPWARWLLCSWTFGDVGPLWVKLQYMSSNQTPVCISFNTISICQPNLIWVIL